MIFDLIQMKAYEFHGDNGEDIIEGAIPAEYAEKARECHQEMIAKLADVDEVVGEKFLMEIEPSIEEVMAAIRKATIALKLVPVFCGSAYKNKGVQLLLNGISDYLPNPGQVTTFKI